MPSPETKPSTATAFPTADTTSTGSITSKERPTTFPHRPLEDSSASLSRLQKLKKDIANRPREFVDYYLRDVATERVGEYRDALNQMAKERDAAHKASMAGYNAEKDEHLEPKRASSAHLESGKHVQDKDTHPFLDEKIQNADADKALGEAPKKENRSDGWEGSVESKTRKEDIKKNVLAGNSTNVAPKIYLENEAVMDEVAKEKGADDGNGAS